MAAQQEPAKPTTAKPAKAPDARGAHAADAKAEAPKGERKRGKGLWIVLGALLLIAIAGGGSFFLLQGEGEAAAKPAEPAVFVPLETFTVNLLPTESIQQYLQVGVTLKVSGQAKADVVKARMPEVRNRILLLLSSKRPSELLPLTGKQKLATEVGHAVQEMLEPPKAAAAAEATTAGAAESESKGAAAGEAPKTPPASTGVEVLFTAFIIQ